MAKGKVEGRDGREGDRSWQWALDRRVVTRTIPPPSVLRRAHGDSNGNPLCILLYRHCWEHVHDYYEFISLSSADFDLVSASASVYLDGTSS